MNAKNCFVFMIEHNAKTIENFMNVEFDEKLDIF